MSALFFRSTAQPSFLSPANEALLEDHRTSSSFFTGNSTSSSLSHREKLSLFFTEVIPSLFLFSFQRDKGIGFRKREFLAQASAQSGRGPLGTLLSLTESRGFFLFIYIGIMGYFLSSKPLWENILQRFGNNGLLTLLPNFCSPFTSVSSFCPVLL
jgi:hypothetical protein